MLDTGRYYLDKGTILHLCRENSNHTDDWEIIDRIGEGGSSVCYTAMSGRKMGRLKVFNPVYSVSGAESAEGFLSAYRTLEEVKAQNPRYQILNNYMPHYELLFGIDGEGRNTGAFVWTPDDKSGTNFADYLCEVRANPRNMPEQAVANILNIVYTLTDCVCLMHSAGILHLDLKPSNFLVTYYGGMELNTGNISLFDINTITSIESDTPMVVGTEGYCAPEVDRGAADNRSDIYSIGAILFNALVVNDGIPQGIWRDEYYNDLEGLVENSKLLCMAETDNSKKLRSKLVEILSKCLNYFPGRRYDYCEQLMEDLQEAGKLAEAVRAEIAVGQTGLEAALQNTSAESVTKKPVHFWQKCMCAVAAACIMAVIILGMSGRLNIGERGNSTDRQGTLFVPDTPDGPGHNETGGDEVVLPTTEKQSEGEHNETADGKFVLSPEAQGTERLNLTEPFVVNPGQKVFIPEEMTLVCNDWNVLELSSGSETVVESGSSICTASDTISGPLVVLKNRAKLTIDGITFYACGGDGWADQGNNFMYLYSTYDEATGERYFNVTVVGDVYVSCDYDTFTDKGYCYYFEDADKPLTDENKESRRAIFFAGSEEPFDEIRKEEREKSEENEFTLGPEMLGTDRYVLTEPFVVNPGQKVFIPKEMTLVCNDWNVLELSSDSEAVVESGSSICTPSHLEDGTLIVLKNRAKLTIDGITFYVCGGDGWADRGNNFMYLCSTYDEATGERYFNVTVVGDVHISCDYNTFISKGYLFVFESEDKPLTDEDKLLRRAVFFAGSAEPFAEIRRAEYDQERIDAEKTLRKVTDLLEDEYKHGFERQFTLDPEMLGSNRLLLTGYLAVWPSLELIIPKETSVVCRDGYLIDMQANSKLVIESAGSLRQPEGSPNLAVAMKTNSTLIVDGISFYATGAGVGTVVYVTSDIEEETGEPVITFNIVGEMYVSCDYETFAEKKFRYRFGYDDEPVWVEICHMDCLAIFFDGSSEPYDVLYKEDFD